MWVHSSPSILAYPTILLLHVFGMTLIVSVAIGIDLRLLGFAPALPIAPLGRFVRFVWIGFFFNAVSGTILAAADAVNKFTNFGFYLKMVFIVLALINLQWIDKRVLHDPNVDKLPVPANVKVFAFLSLVLWLGVILAGRLLAYVGPGSGT